MGRQLGIKDYPAVYDLAIESHQPILLHSHFANRGFYDLPLAKKYSLKHIVTFYGYDVNKLPQQKIWRERYKLLFEKASLFLCEGPYMANCVVNLGCPKEKVLVQRLGIDIENIAYRPRRINKSEPVKILVAGSFKEKKGIPDAIESVGLLSKKHPNVRLTVIGDSSGDKSGKSEKSKIQLAIDRFKLGPKTRLLGFQPHQVLMKEAAEHHIFLSPSLTASDGDTEGGAPVSVIEMAASGLPIVSTQHADIPNIIHHGQTGLLFPEKSPGLLATGLLKLIKNEPLYEKMSRQARKQVLNLYNIRKTAKQLSNIYKQVIKNSD